MLNNIFIPSYKSPTNHKYFRLDNNIPHRAHKIQMLIGQFKFTIFLFFKLFLLFSSDHRSWQLRSAYSKQTIALIIAGSRRIRMISGQTSATRLDPLVAGDNGSGNNRSSEMRAPKPNGLIMFSKESENARDVDTKCT